MFHSYHDKSDLSSRGVHLFSLKIRLYNVYVLCWCVYFIFSLHWSCAAAFHLLEAQDQRRYLLPSFRTSPLAARAWGGKCVACCTLHFIELPFQTSFCPVFIFLLVYVWRLSTLLPPLRVILVFTMCIGVLLLYQSIITHTYFYFVLLGIDNVNFFVFSW